MNTVFLLSFVFHASAHACSLTFTSPQSGQTFSSDKSVESYNANGQLQAIKNRMGVTQTLIYTNGLLASVTDSNGRSLILSYDSSSRLTTLQDPANGLYINMPTTLPAILCR